MLGEILKSIIYETILVWHLAKYYFAKKLAKAEV
jgi:hypothetical protein